MGRDRVVTKGVCTRQVRFRAQQEQYHYVGPLQVLGSPPPTLSVGWKVGLNGYIPT